MRVARKHGTRPAKAKIDDGQEHICRDQKVVARGNRDRLVEY